MKITRKLVTSIVCLALSLAFCVWAVLAWFSANSRADASGMKVSVQTEDLSIVVNVYKLTHNDDGTYSKNGDALTGNGLVMNPYGGTAVTAVLLEVIITNSSQDTAYTVPLTIKCGAFNLDAPAEGSTQFTSNISNGITIYDATQDEDGVNYTLSEESSYSFTNTDTLVDGNPTKADVELFDGVSGVTVNNGSSVTKNYIMDYDPALITYLNSRAISSSDAIVTAEINFVDDLIFVLGEGTPTEPLPEPTPATVTISCQSDSTVKATLSDKKVGDYLSVDELTAAISAIIPSGKEIDKFTYNGEDISGGMTINSSIIQIEVVLRESSTGDETTITVDFTKDSDGKTLSGNITSNVKLNDIVTINATSSSNVTINSNGYLQLNGSGGIDYRNLEFDFANISTQVEITVQFRSNGSTGRGLKFYKQSDDESWSQIGNDVPANASDGEIGSVTFTINSQGTYYIAGYGGGVNIYAVTISYTSNSLAEN